MSLTANDLAGNIRYLWVCAYKYSHVLPYFFPQCVFLSPSPRERLCELVCTQCLSDLGQVLLMWREQSVPGDVLMSHRTVLSAHSQQQFSQANNSCAFTHAHTQLCDWHTYVFINPNACCLVKKPKKCKSTQTKSRPWGVICKKKKKN